MTQSCRSISDQGDAEMTDGFAAPHLYIIDGGFTDEERVELRALTGSCPDDVGSVDFDNRGVLTVTATAKGQNKIVQHLEQYCKDKERDWSKI